MNRAERRRQAKELDALVIRGIDPGRFDRYLMITLINRLYEMVVRAKRNHSVDELMNYIFTLVDRSIGTMPDLPIACQMGCAHCCTVWVAAKAPEVIFFAKSIHSEYAEKFLRNIHVAMINVTGKSFDERGDAIVPCPALADGICANYRHRPTVCRTAASADAEICRRAYIQRSDEGIPTPTAFIALRGTILMALSVAMKQCDLPAVGYELINAIERFFAVPQAEKRWLDGEDIFAGLPTDPMPPEYFAQVESLRGLAFS